MLYINEVKASSKAKAMFEDMFYQCKSYIDDGMIDETDALHGKASMYPSCDSRNQARDMLNLAESYVGYLSREAVNACKYGIDTRPIVRRLAAANMVLAGAKRSAASWK